MQFSFFPGMTVEGQRMGAVHVEARLRFPVGFGFWGAFWLYPEELRYGGWAQSGEVTLAWKGRGVVK